MPDQYNQTSSQSGFAEFIHRIKPVFNSEKREIIAIIVYGLLISFLSLIVPVAIQSLVNTIAFGSLTQQLIILSTIVFLVLCFSGALSAVQFLTVEILQRRLFTRFALDVAMRIPRFATRGLRDRFGPEIVNPFLEVAVFHKSISSLLIGGLGLLLQILVSVILLGLYHPWLFAFAIGLIVVILIIFLLFGRGGIETADKECSAKYEVLTWLEDLARMLIVFHSTAGQEFSLRRADQAVMKWLNIRKKHFTILYIQIISSFLVQAAGSALLLGLGGYLVIKQQLTLGQLVAAELVVNAALSGLAKFGKHLESYYDMMAAIKKLEAIRGIPLESEGSEELPACELTPARLELINLKVFSGPEAKDPILKGINLDLPAGDSVAVFGLWGSGKSVLLDAIYGWIPSYSGAVKIDGYNTKDLTIASIRSRVALVGEPEFFHGTLEDNLCLGRKSVSSKELRELLDRIGLGRRVLSLPDGLQTMVGPQSRFFSFGELLRLSIARALLSKPGLLILDQTLDAFDEESFPAILEVLGDQNRTWSLLVATNQKTRAMAFERRYEIKDGLLLPL
jgi:putative ABC transport system ATP-binding protein